MMVFGHSGGGFLSGKQVFPLDCEAEIEISQRLLEACYGNDLESAVECISHQYVDVNFVGAVYLKSKKTDVVLHDESADEILIKDEEFRTDVSPLFLAVHSGNMTLVRKLLSAGADVNQRLFKGFATTAAVREGHGEVLELLIRAGASQPACEEALIEAGNHGNAKLVALLMNSEMIRQHVAAHTLVVASCRGFVDVVQVLMESGLDADATDRVLLQSSKPSLHMNVDCSALVGAIVSRQISVVRQLLQAGVRTDINVRLGAWSWDSTSGEEFRVGAGLGEPYTPVWCAVEYYESTGSILHLLLQHHSPNSLLHGRTLLHHAILCCNAAAVNHLHAAGGDIEFPVETSQKIMLRPIHLASRLGFADILVNLINLGCQVDTLTDFGESALMISVKHKQDNCLRALAAAGADFGLVNSSGHSVNSISTSNHWQVEFQRAVLDVIRSGKMIKSSDHSVFSPLLFVSLSGDIESLKILLQSPEIDIDEQDYDGFSAIMIAAAHGHVDTFRLLVFSGANVKLCNKFEETAIMITQCNQKRDLFEKVMLEFELDNVTGGNHSPGFPVLHCAARRGDLPAVRLLIERGYDVNTPDGDGFTPIMLAAREGHAYLCEFLISCGARCDVMNDRGETALSLTRKNGGPAEQIVFDEMARAVVLRGGCVKKHTKNGKGRPHWKILKVHSGVLSWGKSIRRNVCCRDVRIGGSASFQKNRKRNGDEEEAGLFRVITKENREVHFMCEGGLEMAELWVRGIQLLLT